MTHSDKENIRRLRGDGLGYKAIAARLKLSPAAVKGYCQRNGLAAKATAPAGDCCLHCGAPLGERLPGAEKKKFCSDSCRYRWWGRHGDVRVQKEKDRRVCAHCRREFYSRKPKKYCTHGCYIIARFGHIRRTTP